MMLGTYTTTAVTTHTNTYVNTSTTVLSSTIHIDCTSLGGFHKIDGAALNVPS